MPIAVSGNSVHTEFNPIPANPRLFTISGEELDRITALWDSKWTTVGYYASDTPEFRDITKEMLFVTVNERKISLSELKFNSVAGNSTKAGILSRIKK
jgi:ribosomal protein L29